MRQTGLPTLVSLATVISVFVLTLRYSNSAQLNEYIKHYEELMYDTHKVHNIAKRSTDVNAIVHVRFKALGKNFNLRLKRDTSVFSKNLQHELPGGKLIDHDVSFIYEGQLSGDSKSRVYGSIIKGTFAGVIKTSDGTYHVEKAEHYFTDDSPRFHSVIYRDEDIVQDPHRLKPDTDTGTCGAVDPKIHSWMNKIQNSAIENSQDITSDKKKRAAPWNKNLLRGSNSHYKMYSDNSNIQKRATRSNRRTCTLFLQSDPYLWKYMTDSKEEKGLGYDDDRALQEITSLFGLHVKGIKTIYEGTVFNYQDMRYTGFSFVIRRVKIMKYDDECLSTVQQNYFCQPQIDVINFLYHHSGTNHDEYCLAYVFTYRVFTGGTLGLAWAGASTRASGGICKRYTEYTENGRGISKSFNTGIVTLANYNSRVPPKISTLTFAHEVGHNFGSPHDSRSSCSPESGNEAGNYIMFAGATGGEQPNNSKFSQCSIGNMTLVFDAVLNSKNGKVNCFVGSEEAFCGNKIVEEAEMCDCGFEEDCTESCCYGRPAGVNKPAVPGSQPCTLKPHVVCSPSQGPCCFPNCTFKRSSENCLGEQQCTMPTDCNGMMSYCPEPPHKANRTFCNDDTQICIDGECQGTICSMVGWLQCYLTAPEDNKDYDKGNLCFVACENPNTKECVSSSPKETALDKPDNSILKDFLQNHQPLSEEGIKLPPGAPCDNFQGYCDELPQCLNVNTDGPIARLIKKEAMDTSSVDSTDNITSAPTGLKHLVTSRAWKLQTPIEFADAVIICLCLSKLL